MANVTQGQGAAMGSLTWFEGRGRSRPWKDLGRQTSGEKMEEKALTSMFTSVSCLLPIHHVIIAWGRDPVAIHSIWCRWFATNRSTWLIRAERGLTIANKISSQWHNHHTYRWDTTLSILKHFVLIWIGFVLNQRSCRLLEKIRNETILW